MARLEERTDAHDEWKKEVTGSLSSINNWLRGIAGSIIVALLLLVVNLMLNHYGSTASAKTTPQPGEPSVQQQVTRP